MKLWSNRTLSVLELFRILQLQKDAFDVFGPFPNMNYGLDKVPVRPGKIYAFA